MKWLVLVLVSGGVGACRPGLDEDEALITSARVLAVKSEPAEAKPGTPLLLSAFVAEPSPFASAPQPAWYFCIAAKPLSENNVVSTACLGNSSLLAAGAGDSIMAATPLDTCSVFGPNTSSGGYRPVDPDATGGYFQPLRLDLLGADPTFHLERVLCNLADASADIATEFGLAYVPNQNPQLLPLALSIAGQSAALSAIPRSAHVDLVASWSAADAENYAYFDVSAQAVTTRREAMSVAWYVSAGKLDSEATGRADDDFALSTQNGWTAPDSAGSARLWLVLRDSRGGTDFATYDATIAP